VGSCTIGALLLAAALCAALPAGAQEAGKQIFQQTCAACHTVGAGRLVGPDLKGVTERRSHEWLVRFVSDPERMRKDDPIAIANLKEFGVPMPRPELSAQQIAAVIDFLKAAQAAPAGMPAQYVPTLVLSLLGIVALTLIGLRAGSKDVDGGMA
jgi:mono/diheme cytochrome c family protein